MKRLAYQLLGLWVWKAVKSVVRQRYGDTSRKLALAGVVVGVVAALVLAGRRTASD